MNSFNPYLSRLTIVLLLCVYGLATASTIGIATGTATVDGRPLLFKTKDRADNFPSDMDYYAGTDQHYAYVFQVNNGQDHTRARMGINSAGFGIVYTTSENLLGAGIGPSGSELAAMALKTCASLRDFRELLNLTAGQRNVHEHYGVIDSSGQGALFEVDGYSHFELFIRDSIGTMANTAKYHPSAGPPSAGSTSPQREARVAWLLENGPPEGLDYRYFTKDIMQDFCTIQADEDLMPVGQYETNAVISRYKTAAGCVIRGCRPGDDPRLESIMWLIPGEPSLSVVMPFCPGNPAVVDEIRASAAGYGMAGSIDRARQLIYDYSNGRYSDRLADTFQLCAIREQTMPLEDSLFADWDSHIVRWRALAFDSAAGQIKQWQEQTQHEVKDKYDALIAGWTPIKMQPEASLPKENVFSLHAWPNPFNSTLTLTYSLSHAQDIKVEIYDVQGRMINSSGPNMQTAGEHIYRWRADRFCSGIYIYRIFAGREAHRGKAILVK